MPCRSSCRLVNAPKTNTLTYFNYKYHQTLFHEHITNHCMINKTCSQIDFQPLSCRQNLFSRYSSSLHYLLCLLWWKLQWFYIIEGVITHYSITVSSDPRDHIQKICKTGFVVVQCSLHVFIRNESSSKILRPLWLRDVTGIAFLNCLATFL